MSTTLYDAATPRLTRSAAAALLELRMMPARLLSPVTRLGISDEGWLAVVAAVTAAADIGEFELRSFRSPTRGRLRLIGALLSADIDVATEMLARATGQDDEVILAVLEGARSGDTDFDQLRQVIELVRSGVSGRAAAEAAGVNTKVVEAAQGLFGFSQAESDRIFDEVYALVCEGMGVAEIARALGVHRNTASTLRAKALAVIAELEAGERR
jgi:transposase-like protein